MKSTACAVCGYPLPGLAYDEVCPECGTGLDDRNIASRRRSATRKITVAYLAAMLPGWCFILTMCLGWFIAHAVIRIPSPHWVQTGEYPALDWLGVAVRLLLPFHCLSCLAAPVLLPIALIAHVRTSGGGQVGRRWAWCFLLLLAATPVVVTVGMMRLFGGPRWGLVDWMPD